MNISRTFLMAGPSKNSSRPASRTGVPMPVNMVTLPTGTTTATRMRPIAMSTTAMRRLGRSPMAMLMRTALRARMRASSQIMRRVEGTVPMKATTRDPQSFFVDYSRELPPVFAIKAVEIPYFMPTSFATNRRLENPRDRIYIPNCKIMKTFCSIMLEFRSKNR